MGLQRTRHSFASMRCQASLQGPAAVLLPGTDVVTPSTLFACISLDLIFCENHMAIETLKLASTLDEAAALQAAQVLNSVRGVRKLNFLTTNASVIIDFDDALTSMQELRTVLTKAGIKPGGQAHGTAGNCCGGCGGS